MTTQEKILEAKKLLEQYAPKGEFLAYINRDEAKTLKELGGSGIIIEETGIPSFNPFAVIGAVMAATSVLSFMGSLKQMKNMQTAAEWDKYHERIDKSYKTIEANKRARLLLSAKRAAQGARGVQIGTGSTLMEQNSVVANLEDTVFWINKGAEMTVREIDLRLASKLQAAAWNTSTSLLTNLGSAYGTSQMKVN
jgi:hypothetical protein